MNHKVRRILIWLLILISMSYFVFATAPILESSRISPSSPLTSQTLLGFCNASDADGDNVTYQIKWYVNNSLYDSSSLLIAPSYKQTLSEVSNDRWAVAANDYYLASSGEGSGGIIIYNKTSFINIENLSISGNAYGAALFFDDFYLYAASGTNLTIFNGTTLSLVASLTTPNSTNPAYNRIYSNNTHLFAGGRIYNIHTWTTASDFPVGWADDTYYYFGNNVSFISNHSLATTLSGASNTAKTIADDNFIYSYSINSDGKFLVYYKQNFSLKGSYSTTYRAIYDIVQDDDYVYTTAHDSTKQRLRRYDKVTGSWNLYTASSGDTSISVFTDSDDAYIYTGGGDGDVKVWDKRSWYTQNIEQNVQNISNTTTHSSDLWTLSCHAKDIISDSGWKNYSVVVAYPPQPTLTDRGEFVYFEDEMTLTNTTIIEFTIDNNAHYMINYTLLHTFNQSCFNVTADESVLSIGALSTNKTNISIIANGTNSCFGIHQAQIIVQDNYYSRNTTFDVNISLNSSYVDIEVGEPLVSVFPAAWACASAVDINATCTKQFNITNLGNASCEGVAITDGFSFSWSPYSLSPGGSTLVSVSTSVPIGSYSGTLDFSCGKSHYRDVDYAFEIIKQSGGGSAQITELKLANITDYCGDGICQDTENPSNCWEDCRINYDTLITCLWDEDLPCNWDQNWFPITLIAILMGVVVVSIYQYEQKEKRRR